MTSLMGLLPVQRSAPASSVPGSHMPPLRGSLPCSLSGTTMDHRHPAPPWTTDIRHHRGPPTSGTTMDHRHPAPPWTTDIRHHHGPPISRTTTDHRHPATPLTPRIRHHTCNAD